MSDRREPTPLRVEKLQPQTAVTDYLFSKARNQDVKKFPEWDIPRREPEVDLSTRRRLLHDAEQRLEARRVTAIKQRQQVNEEWKDLEEKETELRENFMKFNKFVKQNQEKRERADRKIEEDEALIKKREHDIDELQARFDNMQAVRIQMEKNIKDHRMYEEFLLKVVKQHHAFKTIDDVINRYETLADARASLANRHKKELKQLEDMRNDMLRITEENTLEIMGLHNNLSELQHRYANAKNKALMWEGMVITVKNVCRSTIAIMYQVREDAWVLYLQMCERKQIEPEFCKEDIENQMIFIKRTLSEMKRISRIAKKRALKEARMNK